ncbi:MAG: NifB/NifX family molybdenum-iron cluster-binding protein [Candidatus Woesearchaeota archaeon]
MLSKDETYTLIPIASDDGLDSKVALHFGHAPYFALIDSDGELLVVPNDLDHSENGVSPVAQLLERYAITRVVALHMGKKAQAEFARHGVRLLKATSGIVGEVNARIDSLEPITATDTFH